MELHTYIHNLNGWYASYASWLWSTPPFPSHALLCLIFSLCCLNSAEKILCENTHRIMNIIPNCFLLNTLKKGSFLLNCFLRKTLNKRLYSAIKEMHKKTAKEKVLFLLSLWPELIAPQYLCQLTRRKRKYWNYTSMRRCSTRVNLNMDLMWKSMYCKGFDKETKTLASSLGGRKPYRN